jgi:hypothetical protein
MALPLARTYLFIILARILTLRLAAAAPSPLGALLLATAVRCRTALERKHSLPVI